MSTYLNAYKLTEDVRYGVNEHSDAYVQGTDTTGVYQNAHLLTCINRAQRFLYAVLMNYIPEQFLTSTTLTGVNSVYTLPWDFGSLREFKDENGYKVHRSSVSSLPVDDGEGCDLLYYPSGNTLVLNKSGVTETYTLWYYKKPRDIHYAQAGDASGLLQLEMETSDSKSIDDYYNNMVVENTTQTRYDTITDYNGSTKIATIPYTAAENDWYGLVPEIPEIFHHLIAPRAIMIAKAEHPVSPEKPTRAEMDMWKSEVREVLVSFGVSNDITPEDIWFGFGNGVGAGINIPGQGYVI